MHCVYALYTVPRCTVLKTPSDQTGPNVLAIVWSVPLYCMYSYTRNSNNEICTQIFLKFLNYVSVDKLCYLL